MLPAYHSLSVVRKKEGNDLINKILQHLFHTTNPWTSQIHALLKRQRAILPSAVGCIRS